MSPTQQERRIQALYDDANVSRRNLCERTVHLEADMEDVRAENAKLREVAGIMAYCMQAERDCDGCKMNGAAGTVAEPAGCSGLLGQLRELGVIR